MSSKIDNRVVQMKFDSDQFQKGVAETSGALDKLKNALKMDGLGKGLEGIKSVAGNLSLNGLASGVQDVTDRFPALQAVALGVFAMIGAKAVELGQNLVRNIATNLTSAIRDGMSDYNMKLTSVQTIMNATGESIETVNGFFKELDTYADKTVYNLSDMTGAFAKFTNAGVNMDQSVPAIKGIANMVALAGQGANEASIAMYNLSQSIAGGFLTTTDYKSLNLANVATKEWKQNMIDAAVAAGTLKKTGEDSYEVLIDGSGKATNSAALFNEELSRGWATTDVLLGVLGDYGDETTAIGKKALAAAQDVKSLPMMFETLAAQAGTGWTDTFEIVLGNVTESTELFSYLTNEIGKFTDASTEARNSQLELWKEMGGRTAIFDAIKNIFTALNSVLDPIMEAWAEVFPPSLGKTLAAISFAIRDFTKGLILSENAQQNLKMVAKAVFSVLKFGLDVIGGIIKIISVFVGFIFDLAGAFLSLIGPVLTFVRSLIPVKEGAEEASSGVSGFFDMLANAGKFLTGWLPDAIRNLGDLLNNFLNGEAASARLKAFKENLVGVGQAIAMVWNVLTKGDFTSNPFFAEDSKFVDVLFRIREAIINVVDAFKTFGRGVADAAGNAKSFWQGVINVVKAVWEFIKPLVDGIKSYFTDVTGSLDVNTILATINTGILGALAIGIFNFIKTITSAFKGTVDLIAGIGEVLEGLGGVLEAYQTKLKAEALLKIAAAIAILAGGLWVLSTINPERLISAVAGMATAFGILLGGMAVLDKLNAEPSIKASVALIAIAAAVSILATAVETMGKLDPWGLARGLGGIVVAIGVLVVGMKVLDSMKNDIMKGAFALTVMATAVQLLAVAVAAFGLMPLNVLIQGMIGVTAALGLLVGAAVILSKFAKDMVLSAVGMMAMAAALNMLIIPIIAMGLLPFAILMQGMVSLGILLVGLVIAAQQLSASAPKMVMAAVGMMAMAAALNMLVGPLVVLGMLPFGTLLQGMLALGVMLAGLVVATNAMKTAMPGAVAMLAVAGAITILSVAMAILAGIGIEGVITALIGMAGAILILAIGSALLAPVAPLMFTVAGAIAVFGAGLLAISVAMMVAALAIAALGPAFMSLTAGIVAFGKESDNIMAAIGPMFALAAALLVFGVAALIAGAGIIVLAAGFILLGVGLALVGATALIGATALTAFVNMMVKLVQFVPQLLALAVGLGALGLAVTVLGVGLLAAGIGMLAFAAALVILAGMGPALIPLIMSLLDLIPVALAKFGEGVVQFAMIIGNAIPLFVAQFTNLVLAILNAIQVITPKVVQTLLVMLQAMLNGIVAAVPMFVDAAMRLLTGFLNGVAKRLPELMDAGGDVIVKFIEGIGKQATKITKAAGDTILGFINGLSSYIENNTGKFIAAGNRLVKSIVEGVSQAIENSGNLMRWAGERIGNAIIQGAKNFLGINSPSKVFRDYIMGSVFEGVEKGESKNRIRAYRSGSRIGDAVLNGTAKALSNMRNAVEMDMDFTPTIQPVMDLSEVYKGQKAIDSLSTAPTLDVSTSYAVASGLALQQRANEESQNGSDDDQPRTGDTYIQNVYSPKAISDAELYRNTKNLISVKKGEEPK